MQFGIHYFVWRIPFLDVPETKTIFGNFEEIGKLFHLEGDFGNFQKGRDNLGNLKTWPILTKKRDISTSEGKEKE